MDLGDVVVGVVRTDLGFELVVEQEGVKRYQGSEADKNIVSKLNDNFKKHIPTTLQVYHVYYSSLQ